MPDTKEVNDMIDKIHSVLLHYDSQLSSSEKGRSDLENYKQQSILSVVEHHNKIQAKLNERKEQLLTDISACYEKQMEKLHKTESLNQMSIDLMQDRRRLQVALQDDSKLRALDLDAIRSKLDINEDNEVEDQNLKLSFCPTIKLTKLKKIDFGFLQVSDLLPDDLTLVLKTPIGSIAFGSKVTCTVLSNKEFTMTNQDHITFAIKNKSSTIRETVSFVKEDCGVSDDKKKFDITFRVYRPGTYSVTVYLYREVHITNSPMSIPLDNLPTQPQSSSVLADDLSSAMGDITLNKALNRSLRRPHSQLPAPLHLKPPGAVAVSPHTPNSPNVVDLNLQPATPKTPAGIVLTNLYKSNEPQPLTPFTEASNNIMGLIGKEPSLGYNHLAGLHPPAYYGQPAPSQVPAVNSNLNFKIGDRVVAKSSQNGQYYEGTVFLIQDTSAVIMFKESGTSQNVLFSDIQLVSKPTEQETQKKDVIANPNEKIQNYLKSTDSNLNTKSGILTAIPQTKPGNLIAVPQIKSGNLTAVPQTKLKSIDLAAKRPKPTVTVDVKKSSDSPSNLDFVRLSEGAILKGKCILKIPSSKVRLAIGITVLQDNTIIISDCHREENCVKMFDPSGKFLRNVKPGQPFVKPSDAVTLKSGNFAVRDDFGIQVFSKDGAFISNCGSNKIDKCFGLAEDDEGRLITLNWCSLKGSGNGKGGGGLTAKGETDVFFMNVKDGQVVKRIELADIIKDKRNSKCRFLRFHQGKVYITDLGLDCVYILNPVTDDVKLFGSTGPGVGQFSDPAGLVCDDLGNMIIVDSKNHRLQLFNKNNQVVCPLGLDVPVRRPSGAQLHNGELYVLNLQGSHGMTKYKLG